MCSTGVETRILELVTQHQRDCLAYHTVQEIAVEIAAEVAAVVVWYCSKEGGGGGQEGATNSGKVWSPKAVNGFNILSFFLSRGIQRCSKSLHLSRTKQSFNRTSAVCNNGR